MKKLPNGLKKIISPRNQDASLKVDHDTRDRLKKHCVMNDLWMKQFISYALNKAIDEFEQEEQNNRLEDIIQNKFNA